MMLKFLTFDQNLNKHLSKCWHHRELGFSNLVWHLIIKLHIPFILSCGHLKCSFLYPGPDRPETGSSNVTK